MAVTRLWFVRHGEVEERWLGRFVGSTDAALSDLGRHQAEALAAFLGDADIDAVLTSPRRRAVDTATPLARRLGMQPEVRSPFAEMDFGAWEGLTWEEVVAQDPDFAARWQADPGPQSCPGGQAADAFAATVQAALGEALEEFAGRSVVVAGHAGVSRAILAKVLDRPYMEAFRFAQDYGAVNAAAWPEDGLPQVALWNLVPGPRSKHGEW